MYKHEQIERTKMSICKLKISVQVSLGI